jgi:hypothetical protein
MADPQIDLVKIRNAELARRGLGAAQGISDFAAPVRDTLYSGIANPLAYLKDMSLAALSGIYGAASDISGFGASALGAPELGKQLFSQADEGYGSAMTRLKGALPGVPDISGFGPQDMTDIFNDENLGIPAFDVQMPATDRRSTDRSGKVSSSAGALGSKVIPSNVQGGRGKDPRAQIAKDKTEIEKLMGINNNNAPTEAPDSATELYNAAYEEYMRGLLGDAPSGPDSIEKYKQDFAKATGLDVSGKPDTSQALMAFGLAAMQNRAGKGFNVGRMLESLGQAGEKALPELAKARDNAKTAQVAAGKYALEKVAAQESAGAAYDKELREWKRELMLKNLEIEAAAQKAADKGVDYKNVANEEIVNGVFVSYGGDNNGRTVLSKPTANAPTIVSAYNRYSIAQDNINNMSSLLAEINSSSSPNFSVLADKVNSTLVGYGLKDAKVTFGETGASAEDRIDAGRKGLVNEFKRLILQESQVSDLDLKTMNQSMGELDFLGNPQKSQIMVDNLYKYFGTQKSKLAIPLEQMQDRYYYRNDQEFDKVQEILNNPVNGLKRSFTPTGESSAPAIGTLDLTKTG